MLMLLYYATLFSLLRYYAIDISPCRYFMPLSLPRQRHADAAFAAMFSSSMLMPSPLLRH